MRNGSFSTPVDALRALHAAQSEGDPFEVIISDYQMPEIDGITLAATIKSDPSLGDPMFILLTSVSDRQEPALETGNVDACLLKPVRHTKLLRTMVEVWQKRQGDGHGAGRAPAAQSAAPGASVCRSMDALRGALQGEFAMHHATVLVVEDTVVNQKVAILQLRKLGVRADVAANGQEGVDMLRMRPYDLVLMDCQMPVMNGYEATGQVRAMHGPNGGIPIIAMTADAVSGSRERCLQAGMDDFISKPVAIEELSRVLRAWLPVSMEPEVPLTS
jgi:CheY-like chemotaxis protein